MFFNCCFFPPNQLVIVILLVQWVLVNVKWKTNFRTVFALVSVFAKRTLLGRGVIHVKQDFIICSETILMAVKVRDNNRG